MENSAGKRYTELLDQARKCLDEVETLHARAYCYLASIVLFAEENNAEWLGREIREAGEWLRTLPDAPRALSPVVSSDAEARAARIREIKRQSLERLGRVVPSPPPPKKS